MGITWRGIVHDMSKFLPCEWFPYVEHFYGSGKNDEEFDAAWLHHQKFNKHHWQYWLLQKDSGECVPMKMPIEYVKELLADWRGVTRAFGKPVEDTTKWYIDNKDKMILHPETRRFIESSLFYQTY